jgi:hypothetical protein
VAAAKAAVVIRIPGPDPTGPQAQPPPTGQAPDTTTRPS